VGETLCFFSSYTERSAFSILERIDVGETFCSEAGGDAGFSFSILERIDVGETRPQRSATRTPAATFSILERIDVGETSMMALSDSGRGEGFQYPRTDRRG